MEEWLDFSELVDKVQELIDLGLFDDAQALLDAYASTFNEEWELHFLYSRLFTEQNKPEEAIPCLHRGLRIDRSNVDCLLGLFYAHAMMNQVKKGGRYLLRARKYHPDHELVLSALIWYHTELNELELAIACFDQIRKIGTSNPETYRNAGLAYERSGDSESAEHCFRTALDLNPQYEEVRDMLADHYIFAGESSKAIDLYLEALKESPKNIRILSRLVFCYSQDNQLEQAQTLAKESIRLYPNSPIGYVDLAYVYLNNDEFENAIQTSERALDISPIDPEAFRAKAIAYSEKGDVAEADRAFETSISLDPENAEILRDYYHHLRNAEQYEKMEKLVNSVIELESPYCMEDYWFLADYYREKGDNQKAFSYLHKAYKSMPGEKELMPPIIDILLDEGHEKYSMPFLLRYVEKSGWNDTMNQFSKHKRLRGKWAQEGIRFLRFWGQRPLEFRRFIFAMYLKYFISGFLVLIILLALIPIYLLFGIAGIVALGVGAGAAFGSYFAVRMLVRKNIRGFRSLGGAFPQ